jgi:ribonuclease HII
MDCREELLIANDVLGKECAFVIGADEAGRGPLAGPVAVAAVCVRVSVEQQIHEKLNDSKLMKESDREQVFSALLAGIGADKESVLKTLNMGKVVTLVKPSAVGVVGIAASLESKDRIDSINILNASLEGMGKCIERLLSNPELKAAGVSRRNTVVLIDGIHLPWCLLNQVMRDEKLARKKPNQRKTVFIGDSYDALLEVRSKSVIGGDRKCPSIAAASVIAKVSRDAFAKMVMSECEPQFAFDVHKGYPTPRHMELLATLGPGKFHRKSFRPVTEAAEKQIKKESCAKRKRACKSAVESAKQK